MKKYILVLLHIMTIFLVFVANAEEIKKNGLPEEVMIQKNEDTPAGMEVIKVGDGQEILVPEGTKIRRIRIGAQLILEDTSAYFAKKFMEMENHFMKIEENLQELRQKIKDLEKKIPQQNSESLISANKER
jgi:prefoldin subunit 5